MSWSSIRGHDQIIKAIRHVIRRGRLAHAYLFVGPVGVGKRLVATEMAKALLCETHPEQRSDDSCDRCPGCTQVTARTHPDFQLLEVPEGKHEFPIALMQEAIAHLGLKPARGRHRVTIIDEADLLSEEAANCFLKTLEEPPPASLLILLAPGIESQLPTVRSRCQVIRFGTLPDGVVAELLVSAGIVKTPAEADKLAPLCQGSLNSAQLLKEPEVRGFREEIAKLVERPAIDSVELGQKLVKFVEAAGQDSAAKRRRGQLALQFIIEHLRAQLHAASAGVDEREGRLEAVAESVDRTILASQQIDRRLQLVLALEGFADNLGQLLR